MRRRLCRSRCSAADPARGLAQGCHDVVAFARPCRNRRACGHLRPLCAIGGQARGCHARWCSIRGRDDDRPVLERASTNGCRFLARLEERLGWGFESIPTPNSSFRKMIPRDGSTCPLSCSGDYMIRPAIADKIARAKIANALRLGPPLSSGSLNARALKGSQE